LLRGEAVNAFFHIKQNKNMFNYFFTVTIIFNKCENWFFCLLLKLEGVFDSLKFLYPDSNCSLTKIDYNIFQNNYLFIHI
jgi:hypothetical protein